MPLLAVSTVSHLRTPAGVRAAPKLGPEPKKPQQHIGTREHPEPRGETALRGRETRQLGFRPSKREIEGEQHHVLETHRHRWRVIPTCESERSVYTCGVARRTASLGSGNSFHHRVLEHPTIAATPARPRLSSCAESLHKSKCRPQPAPRLQASDARSRAARARKQRGPRARQGAISPLSRSSAPCTSCFLHPLSLWRLHFNSSGCTELTFGTFEICYTHTRAPQRTRPILPRNL